ncbi:NAD(P)H-dependent oxidoreductase [Flavobacterium bizetiae]|uniref:FMN-dependent NADH-azoreductase n=1 Tax=Flavobacterium bizetiae TaxID=2704140 RepID=UPI0021E944CD|nr:NAD(P)H-dependent oxidoreductase [Flavobacterium bizetiae]UTN03225.1 NAD(P)H-dependent oxidoreductase [Flavobacterium bizetiae]
MKKILVINSSARTLNSHSRNLTEVFVNHWKSIHTNPEITFRELGNTDVPHINENWIAAAFKPETARSEEEKEALKTSDLYIAELHQADIIVVGTPMYNWSVPSALKAYIDQVVRVNETWKLNPGNYENPYIGLLENKTVVLLLSRGSQGYEKGEFNAHMNFQTDYLKTVFNVMGVHNIHMIAIDGATLNPELLKEKIENSHQKVQSLIEKELL